MKKSVNKKINEKKFYYTEKGKMINGFFFLLPSISISQPKILNWNLSVISIFFAIGYYYFQINICTKINDSSMIIQKDHMVKLMSFLRENKLRINDMDKTIDFLNKNNHLLSIIKNSNLSHPYMKRIFLQNFNNQQFVEPITEA